MPVYNGESSIRAAIDSLLGQTYRDFILAISDNASTDRTGDICREYAARDSRVLYVRQPKNIGATANFEFVLREAKTEFFMWAAADDIRSPDYLELNLAFLIKHPDYLGSTSPVRFSGGKFNEVAMGDEPLRDDDRYERLIKYFSAWHANGRYYSLFRRDAVATWSHLSDAHFLGSDWTLVTHLAAQGKLNRTTEGWVELGRNGMSNTTDIFAHYRKDWGDWIFPFGKVIRDTLEHMSGATFSQTMRVSWKLMRLNLNALILQVIFKIRRRRKGA